MKNVAKALASVALVSLGLAGLYLKIEYSGWVLAGGLVTALSLD